MSANGEPEEGRLMLAEFEAPNEDDPNGRPYTWFGLVSIEEGTWVSWTGDYDAGEWKVIRWVYVDAAFNAVALLAATERLDS